MDIAPPSEEMSSAAMKPLDVPSEPMSDDGNNNTKSTTLLTVEEQKMVDIEKPHHHDVLCGRGVTTNRHEGNISFRSLVGINKEMYVSSTKRQKMAISRSIVEAVRTLDPPGRFLDKDPQTGLWYDVGHKKAVEKTSQALRDGAAILRKQLSADLGDPDFLNDVFNVESAEKDEQGETKKEIGKASGKENNKGRSPEKVKPVKAKSSSIKKGHRRVRSNPSALSVAISRAGKNRERVSEFSESPGRYPPRNYGMYPPSPLSPGGPPPPRHARSLPNSPMASWGGGPSPNYSESPGSSYPPRPHQHSPYHQPSPQEFSPYGRPSNHMGYARSHSMEYHHPPPPHGPPPPDAGPSPRHQSWSPYGSRPPPLYHHHSHQKHYHHHGSHPPPGHYPASPSGPRSPAPPSSSEGVPLPTGRHKFSPARYFPGHGPAPEWSPRRVHHHPYNSSHHYSPHQGEFIPPRSANWTPRSASAHRPQEYYSHYDEDEREYSDDDDDEDESDGLAVPSLGGTPRSFNGEKTSPKVHLAPRARPVPTRSIDTPPRPPRSVPRDFDPPASPNRQQPRSKEQRRFEGMAVEEEKKTPEAMDVDPAIEKKDGSGPCPPVTLPSNHDVKADAATNRDSPMGPRFSPVQEFQERESSDNDLKVDDDIELRASPGFFLEVDADGNVEAVPNDDKSGADELAEDIAMSPIPYDREDPISLMDLPENLLSLPISPCGPNDYPTGGCCT